MTQTESPLDVVGTYYDAWRADDFDRLRSVLVDDMRFNGPLAQIEGADECVEGLKRMSEVKTDIVVERMLSDGADVLTWFELRTAAAPPIPVASWGRVKDGKLVRLDVTFDPRRILPPA